MISCQSSVDRSISAGKLFNVHAFKGTTSNTDKYFARSQNFDRRSLFLNFEFDKMFQLPNRRAKYANGNNAFFPRMYNDLWADHWVYFSGPVRKQDDLVSLKRYILGAATLFTALYLVITFGEFIRATFSVITQKRLDESAVASLLFVGCMMVHLIAAYMHPRPGKNDIAQATYIMGYYWFPLFCLLNYLKKHLKFAKFFYTYSLVLFFICMPLYYF